MNENKRMIKSFRDMDVWKMAHECSVDVFEITTSLPRSEDYALTSQIRRSANSVFANIAEAFGRSTRKDKNYFYTISRGSAFETQNHLLYGVRVKYFDAEKAHSLMSDLDQIIHQLNKIMKSLSD